MISRKPHLWLIYSIGVIVPRRLRADWRMEWEAELRRREAMIAGWDKLDWRTKLDLFRHSLGAFWDALWLQPRRWEDAMIQDLRFGVRMLWKKTTFTAIAVLTIALGVGANTAVFSVINAVLLRALPFADAGRLVIIWETHPDIPRAPVSIPDYQDWRAQSQSFQEMAVHSDRYRNAVLTGVGEPTQVQGSFISQNLFPVLGLNPVLGRNFLPEEEEPANNRVVILSQRLWRENFSSDPGVIGKSVQLNGGAFTVVGVMGEQYPLERDVWLPLTHLRAEDFNKRNYHRLSVIGRLKPGVTIEQARREMEMIAARLAQGYPESNKNIGVELRSLRDHLVGDFRPVILAVFAAVALVLLIACANVSNLLLSQAAGRRKELAVRAALGAGRARLTRQLLIESLLLATLGGAAGLVLARWSIPLLQMVLSGITAGKVLGLATVGVDLDVLGFSALLTIATGLLFGALPAMQISRLDLNQVIKEGGKASADAGRRSLNGSLVVAEVALAVVVMIGAGLLVRSFQRLISIDPGFRVDHLLSLKIDLPQARYQDDEKVNNFYQRLTTAVSALPGVQQSALISQLPFANTGAVEPWIVEDHPTEPGKEPIMQMRTVNSRFFEMMRIPLRSGRVFTESEILDNPRNWVVINETLARRFFANRDPLGKRLFIRGPQEKLIAFSIIGVVADIKDLGLDAPVEPEIYFPGVGRMSTLLARTTVDPSSLAATVRRAALSIDSELSIPQARSIEDALAASLSRRRILLGLLGVSAFLALALAAIGVYGVAEYAAAQRTQEIGIRIALGAQARDVIKLIFGREVRPALLGLAFGLAGALALSQSINRFVSGYLFEVRAADPTTFLAIAVLLILIASIACYLPARRATKIDPLAALRHDG
jgi:predicted permease